MGAALKPILNVGISRQHMAANKIAATQPCTVVGFVIATGAPFSRRFESYQIAEQWVGQDAAATGIEITRIS